MMGERAGTADKRERQGREKREKRERKGREKGEKKERIND